MAATGTKRPRLASGVEAGDEVEPEHGPFSLQEVHPLGVQPLGNALLDQNGGCRLGGGQTEAHRVHARRTLGLGSLAVLSDRLLLDILGSLTAEDLARLCCCSKAAYAFASHEELWRAQVLTVLGGSFTFTGGSWRRTYASKMRQQQPSQSCLIGRAEADQQDTRSKLYVRDLYSDLLFQPHFCAKVELYTSWLADDNFPRMSLHECSLQDFRNQFEGMNRPVVIRDGAASWPAIKLWTRSYLQDAFGEAKAVAGGYEFRLVDYFTYCDACNKERVDDQPLYLFDRSFVSKAPKLAADYRVPAMFAEDLFSLLGEERRPHYRWIIMGPARSGSTFHQDPNATSAWNAVVCGSKKWIMFPPHVTPPGVHPSRDGADVVTPVSLVEWFLNFYEEAKGEYRDHMVEGIVRQGEVLFVPRGWWHLAINLEESIAITQNFVSEVNLPHVLDFLGESPSQVSGVDKDERQELYQKFVQELERSRPDLMDQERKRRAQQEKQKRLAMMFRADGAATQEPFRFNFF